MDGKSPSIPGLPGKTIDVAPDFLYMIALAVSAYLLGSIPCGLVLSRAFGAADPRRHGSANIGATNVARVGGLGLGLATLAADVLKGLVPVGMASVSGSIGSPEGYPVALALLAFFGHLFPLYTGFRGGGKGVATAAGGFVLITPLGVFCALAAFVVCVSVFRRISIGSLAAALILPLAAYADTGSAPVSTGAALASAFIFIRHLDNIRRLAAGSEPVFRVGRNKE
jgi:glycerol-3-phosphate acyltransferase PlsY